ncbi:MAG TPA: hypothetical protein VH877_08155 [Polyangia bacterium]|jgi:hypothetical protein|nr:hypothetical protein [Polyangia bacterium]
MRRHLPVLDESILDNIGVASPCEADWSRMKGDDRVRHCSECRQNVYHLSAMSRREAAELVARHEGRICVRLLQRPDGTLVTRDCREILCRARQRGMWAFLVALVVVGLLQIGLKVWGVRTLIERWDDVTHPRLMGAMRPVDPVPATLAPIPPEPQQLIRLQGELAPAPPAEMHIKMGKVRIHPAPRSGAH